MLWYDEPPRQSAVALLNQFRELRLLDHLSAAEYTSLSENLPDFRDSFSLLPIHLSTLVIRRQHSSF